LRHIVETCKHTKPAAIAVARKWDETKQIVYMNWDSDARPVKDSVEVMVSSLRLCISWQRGRPMLCLDIVMPCVPLPTNSSANIYAATFRHPSLKGIHETVKELLALAEFAFLTNEADGALGNDRYHAWVKQDDRVTAPETMVEYHPCSNHGQHLVSASLMSSFNCKMASSLYCSSMFFAYNGHFVRLVRVVAKSVEKHLVVQYRDSHDDGKYALEYQNFVIRNEGFTVKFEPNGGVAADGKYGKRVEEAFVELRKVTW